MVLGGSATCLRDGEEDLGCVSRRESGELKRERESGRTHLFESNLRCDAVAATSPATPLDVSSFRALPPLLPPSIHSWRHVDAPLTSSPALGVLRPRLDLQWRWSVALLQVHAKAGVLNRSLGEGSVKK